MRSRCKAANVETISQRGLPLKQSQPYQRRISKAEAEAAPNSQGLIEQSCVSFILSHMLCNSTSYLKLGQVNYVGEDMNISRANQIRKGG